jgi:hypothetical protein
MYPNLFIIVNISDNKVYKATKNRLWSIRKVYKNTILEQNFGQ